ILAQDAAFGIEGSYGRRNVFEHSFHELTAAFELLDGLLQVSCELIDLRTRIAQLRGHCIERFDEKAELVLSLLGNLKIEIAGRDFARSFGESLNGHGDLFREVKREPHQGKEKKDGEEDQNQQQLTFEGA